MPDTKTDRGVHELQAGVNDKFVGTFGRTPLQERLDDILRMAVRTSRFTDFANLKEQTGDLLNSVLQLCNECDWRAEDLSALNLEKIERRFKLYHTLGRKLKVAIFGGAFDPVTTGHIANAQLVLNYAKEFDEVWLMPCFTHMYGKNMAPPEDRLAMCNLAAKVDRRIKDLSFEINNEMGGETYHLMKTLLEDPRFKDRYDFSVIIGLDNAKTFDKWVNYDLLERQVRFVVVARPGVEEDPKVQWYRKMPHIFLQPQVPEDLIKISSTDIRRMMKSNDPAVEKYLHPEVLQYIRDHKLYI